MFSLLLILFHSLIAILLFYNFYYKRKGLPPGPIPLPFVGNLLTIKRLEPGEECFLKWQHEYGGVYTYWLGENPVVCVADYKTMIDTFLKDGDSYAGRFNFDEFNQITKGGNYGVIQTEGELWRDQRRFALHVLRDFGLGKNLMQEKILDEISSMIQKINTKIDENKSEEINICDYFDIGIGSIINSLLFGYRFDGEKTDEFFQLKNCVSQLINDFGQFEMQLIMAHPYLLRNIPIFKEKYIQALGDFKLLFKFYEEHINEHMKNNNDEIPTDYVGAFLAEKTRRDKLGFEHYYNLNQLINMCFDLWVAGQETTSTTLAWGLAFVLNTPRIMEKIHKELDQVIYSDRLITVSDRPNLPYMNALVNETQRMANLVPNNVLHKTTRAVTVGGYFIPENTIIVPQISTLLANENIFEKCKEFKPERFLNENNELIKYDELIPFSLGKRQCLGESLARMELFLFLANVFNQYKFTVGKQIPSLKRRMGGTAQCPHYKCIIEKRF